MSSDVQQVDYQTASGDVKTYSYPKSRYRNSSRKDGRRVGERKRGGWQVAEMWERHHEIARRIVLGQSNVDIAKDLGVSAQAVSNVRNSPVVKEHTTLMNAARDVGTIDLARDIADLAPLALKRVKEALEGGEVLGRELSGSAILKEANQLLDREIGKPTQRVDMRGVHTHLTLDDINRIKEKARRLAGQSGQMIFSDETQVITPGGGDE